MFRHIHIGMRVADVGKSTKFYTELLNCKLVKNVVTPNAKCTFLSSGDTLIELVGKDGGTPPASEQMHLAFFTDDIFASVKRLLEYGVKLEEEGYPFSKDNPRQIGENSYILFFRGPGGELIEICQNAGTGN